MKILSVLMPLLMPVLCTKALAAPNSTAAVASWYVEPGMMANGKPYRRHALTIAHPTLPFGTRVRLTAANGKAVEATVTDRQAHWLVRRFPQRVVDATPAVFARLGCSLKKGLCNISLQVLSSGQLQLALK